MELLDAVDVVAKTIEDDVRASRSLLYRVSDA